MNTKRAFTKLGVSTLFASPGVIDAAVIYFDIPDTTLLSMTSGTGDNYRVVAFDLGTQSAIQYDYVSGVGPSFSVLAGTKVGFDPDFGVVSKRASGKGGYVGFNKTHANKGVVAGKNTYVPELGKSVPAGYTTAPLTPYTGAPKPETFLSGYYDSGVLLSPYIPADGSTNYQFFAYTQHAQYGWLEMSMSPDGQVTLLGVYYEPIPESSTNLAIATTLAGSAFIYARRKRRKAKEQSESAEA